VIREVGAGIQLGPNAFRILPHGPGTAHGRPLLLAPHAIRFAIAPPEKDIFRQDLGAPFVRRFGHPVSRCLSRGCAAGALGSPPGTSCHAAHRGGVSQFSRVDDSLLITTDRGSHSAAALIGADASGQGSARPSLGTISLSRTATLPIGVIPSPSLKPGWPRTSADLGRPWPSLGLL